jgi:hypothetical protein
MGQRHLNLLPLGRMEHVPPFLHGDDEHKFDLSQFLPVKELLRCCGLELFRSFHQLSDLPENPS